MPNALFLRLLASEDKGADLASVVAALRQGQKDARVFEVDPESFRQIPGSPFAYWVSDSLRRKFREIPPFESDGRTVKQGLATADDFRFVRAWWEVSPERILDAKHGPDWSKDLKAFQAWCRRRTHEGKRWVPFAKGGEYSPYYADIHLVVNWRNDGMEVRNFVGPNGRLASRPQNTDYYFRPGLTWPRSTVKGFNVRVMPAGCIFADKGPAAFFPADDARNRQRLAVLGIMNSELFSHLLLLQTASRAWEVGLVQQTPLPEFAPDETSRFATVVEAIYTDIRSLDQCDEVSRCFINPFIHGALGLTLEEMAGAWVAEVQQKSSQVNARKASLSLMALDVYGVEGPDRDRVLHGASVSDEAPEETGDSDSETEREDDARLEAKGGTVSAVAWAGRLLSYAVGCVFGRWDVRIATGERPLPELPDPFDPLPVCSPGMLQGEDGLPLRSTPRGYPIAIDWDGILVDDPGHPDDLMARIRQVLEVIYQKRAGAIEAELCGLLGVSDLRDYFRRPTKGGFWLDHVARYSKSRRRAPIYWLLQSKKRSYALWLYYHRLDQDLLYKALVNYVEPKLRLEEARLKELEQARTLADPTGREAKQLARDAEQQEELLQELTDFAQALSRAAQLHLRPDLDDGVLLNIAPLWELVPWKESATAWQELLAGKYSWSSIGQQLKERGVVKS